MVNIDNKEIHKYLSNEIDFFRNFLSKSILIKTVKMHDCKFYLCFTLYLKCDSNHILNH